MPTTYTKQVKKPMFSETPIDGLDDVLVRIGEIRVNAKDDITGIASTSYKSCTLGPPGQTFITRLELEAMTPEERKDAVIAMVDAECWAELTASADTQLALKLNPPNTELDVD